MPDDDLLQEDALITEEDADTVTTMLEADRCDGVDCRSAGGPLWRNRTEAYATLADYLADVEPLSTTPLLIRRAVYWAHVAARDNRGNSFAKSAILIASSTC